MACKSVKWSLVIAIIATEEGWQVLDPHPKLICRRPGRLITGVVADAEDLIGQKVSYGPGHAREPVHEEIDRIPTEAEVKRRAGVLGRVNPAIGMINP